MMAEINTPAAVEPAAIEPPPAEPIGPQLRAARRARGDKPIAAIAEELRIRPHLLEALENDDFSPFPGLVYAVGFLRTYAEYLGLDARELAERLRRSQQAQSIDAALIFPEPLEDSRMPRRWMAVAASLLCLVVYGAWYAFSSRGEDAFEAVPEVSADLAVSAGHGGEAKPAALATASEPRPVLALASAEAAPAPVVRLASVEQPAAAPRTARHQPSHLVLKARHDAWVRIEGPDHKPIVDKVLRAGEAYDAPSGPGVKLMTGNAGALDVVVNGKVLGALGPVGAIRRDIRLADLQNGPATLE